MTRDRLIYSLRAYKLGALSREGILADIDTYKSASVTMISKETIEAVRIGVLNDEQLDEAIKHYKDLTDALQVHGDIYHLTWNHLYKMLNILEDMKRARQQK